MKILKVLGALVASILIVVGAVFAWAYSSTEARLAQKYEITLQENIAIPSDPGEIERGKHLVNSLAGCGQCHGIDLGGRLEAEIPGLMTAYTPNITQGKGGKTAGYTDADWVRAIRHGIRRDGTPIALMPSSPLSKLTDADIGAIVAAVKTFPPVDREMPPFAFGPIGYMLVATKQLEVIHAELIDHTLPAPRAVSFPTVQSHGAYLASTGGCVDCHRADLSGGRIPGTPKSIPPAANLTQAGPIAKYSEADFKNLFRTGKRPNGSALHEIMPWKSIGKMHDNELGALYAYLVSLPPVATRD